MKYLTELEEQALSFQNSGDYEKAAEIFKKIIDEYPNYEFGSCFYSLAHCLEELGNIEEAKKYYIKAIEYDNEDPIRLGGYASFLYLHGDQQEAFEKYLELIKLKRKLGFDDSKAVIALKEIGRRIGLTEEEVTHQINSL